MLGPADYEAAIPGLAGLLVDAVDSGAGVNFLAGLDEATAAAWWRARLAAVADGTISPRSSPSMASGWWARSC